MTAQQPRRRGRPRREEGPAVTREAIVAAALESVRNHGLRGLALREVARQLGVSLPSVQRHFSTRDDLWRACVDQFTSERAAALAALPSAVPGVGLADLIRMQFERAAVTPGFTAAMWHDPDEGAVSRLDYLEERARPVVELGRAQIERAIDSGTLRSVDPDIVAALVGIGFGSLANSAEALRRLFGIDLDDEGTRERFAAALADLLLNGLLAERQPQSDA